MFLLIDNYDSFTWNIYHYLSSLDIKVEVKRNDKINLKNLGDKKYLGIIFSPGPGRPENAGNMMNTVCHSCPSFPRDANHLGLNQM